MAESLPAAMSSSQEAHGIRESIPLPSQSAPEQPHSAANPQSQQADTAMRFQPAMSHSAMLPFRLCGIIWLIMKHNKKPFKHIHQQQCDTLLHGILRFSLLRSQNCIPIY